MSDVMLLGVLRMPPECWTGDPVDEAQRFGRYKQAAHRIESDAARIAWLEAALVQLRDCDWVITLPDRMDAVREIARKALEQSQ